MPNQERLLVDTMRELVGMVVADKVQGRLKIRVDTYIIVINVNV